MIAILSAIAFSVAGAALAQDAHDAPPDQIELRYDRMPDRQDFARNYPRQAFARNIQGVGVLCCNVRDDRTLDCAALFEAPRDEGFGAASVVVARKFRLNQESFDRYRAGPQAPIRRAIIWSFQGPRSEAFQSGLGRVREATANICETGQSR